MFVAAQLTSVFVYDVLVCGVTFFGAIDDMVGGDGDATALWTGVNEDADSVEYELFSELGYSSVTSSKNKKQKLN